MEAEPGEHVPDTAAINRYISDYAELSGGLITDEESSAMYRSRLVFELLVLDRALQGEKAYPVD